MATRYIQSPLDSISWHRANPAYMAVVWTPKTGTLSRCGHTPMSCCGLIWYTFHIWYSLPLSCIPGTHFHHLAHILVTLLSHTIIALHTHPVNQHNKHSCHCVHLLLTPHCVHPAHIPVTMDTWHMLPLPCTNYTHSRHHAPATNSHHHPTLCDGTPTGSNGPSTYYGTLHHISKVTNHLLCLTASARICLCLIESANVSQRCENTSRECRPRRLRRRAQTLADTRRL